MKFLKYLCVFSFISAFLFCNDITTPVKEFSVHGHLTGGPRQIKYFDELSEEYSVGTLEVEKINDLSVFSLYNTHGNFIAKIEEQPHEKEHWFTYDRIFTLKDNNENPIGSLILHYNYSSLSYEFFESGNKLFYNSHIFDDTQYDYFIKDKLAVSELSSMRSRKVTLMNPALLNEKTWISFVMIKAMLWRVTGFTRSE